MKEEQEMEEILNTQENQPSESCVAKQRGLIRRATRGFLIKKSKGIIDDDPEDLKLEWKQYMPSLGYKQFSAEVDKIIE